MTILAEFQIAVDRVEEEAPGFVSSSPRISSFLHGMSYEVHALSVIMEEAFLGTPAELVGPSITWYIQANEVMREGRAMTDDLLSEEQAAMLLSVLSQRTSWKKNQEDFFSVCADLEAFRSHSRALPGLKVRARNVVKVLNAEDMTRKNFLAYGPKLGAFGVNILRASSGIWCHDSHMMKWVRGHKEMIEAFSLRTHAGSGASKGEHTLCWVAAEMAASRISFRPNSDMFISGSDVQAAIWCTLRGGAA